MIGNTGKRGAPRTLVTRRGSVGPIRDTDLSALRVAYTTVGQTGDRRLQPCTCATWATARTAR